MNIKPTLLLDIMEDGRFVCQIPYYQHGMPRMVDGNIIEVHDFKDIEKYVYEKRPSLRNRNISIAFAQQRVY